MTKLHNVWKSLPIFLFAFCALGAGSGAPSTSAEKLEKGIELYDNYRDDEARDYFVDVMMNGTGEEINIANRYLNLMHQRMGGIQTPRETPVKQAEPVAAPIEEQEETEMWVSQESEPQTSNGWTDDQYVSNQEEYTAYQGVEGDSSQQEFYQESGYQEEFYEENSAQQESYGQEDGFVVAAEDEMGGTAGAWAYLDSEASRGTTTSGESAFEDLSSPQAVEAREVYSRQKIDSMLNAVIDRLRQEQGVHLYMRNNRPDALDIEPDVVFDGNKFRPEAQSLLNDVYELLALTQDASYTILPPGSYTDDVTLPRMRQAMAFNSYLVSRGISQGKVHYNMGLVNEEPPARYANLNGLSVVSDYDRDFPTVLAKNEHNETAPLLSMAVVPPCSAIDRALAEAFVIDFSVLETVNPLSSWVLQIVQHGHDGKFYVVRQLEGVGPVYHQFLWNGRKGIIGPELPCGKYTLVLTGVDSKGNKQTLRRRLVVKCSSQQQRAASCVKACADCEKNCMESASTSVATVSTKDLNYKAARLWSKPKRWMGGRISQKSLATAGTTRTADSTAFSTTTKTVKNTTIIQEYDDTDPLAGETKTTQKASYPPAKGEVLPTNNPYDMPYEH